MHESEQKRSFTRLNEAGICSGEGKCIRQCHGHIYIYYNSTDMTTMQFLYVRKPSFLHGHITHTFKSVVAVVSPISHDGLLWECYTVLPSSKIQPVSQQQMIMKVQGVYWLSPPLPLLITIPHSQTLSLSSKPESKYATLIVTNCRGLCNNTFPQRPHTQVVRIYHVIYPQFSHHIFNHVRRGRGVISIMLSLSASLVSSSTLYVRGQLGQVMTWAYETRLI